MPEQVGYRRSTILTCGLLLRRVRVCRLLVPEGSAETRRNIFLARVLDLQTLCSLDRTATMPEQVAIADRRCSRGFFFDEYDYECAGVVECPHFRERRQPRWSVARTVDQWPCRVVGEKRVRLASGAYL